jgi:hypothetical protein
MIVKKMHIWKLIICFFALLLFWASNLFVKPVAAHIGDAYCSPNYCVGSNAYLQVLDCKPNNTNTSCLNNGTRDNVVMYCTTADCKGGAPGGGGCSGLTPYLRNGVWDCPDPKNLTVSCCSNSSSPAPTTAPGQPTNTPVPQSTSYWRVGGWTKNSTGGYLSGVTLTMDWPFSANQTYTSSSTGTFVVTKNAANVDSSGNFKITAFKSGSWPFYAVGTPPSGCSKTDGNKAYSCSMDMGYNKPDPPPLNLNFQAIAPTPTPMVQRAPICTNISINTTITKGANYPFSISAYDPDDGTTNGAGIGFIQAFWRFTDKSNAWQKVSADDYSATYNFTLASSTINFSGSSKQIEVIANVYKVANCTPYKVSCTTGNQDSNETIWTESTACRKVVTVNSVTPTPAPLVCAGPVLNTPVNNCSGTTKSVSIAYSRPSPCTNFEFQKATNTSFTADVSTLNDSDGTYAISGLTKTIPHYFRGRCIAKQSGATCTLPSAWSATQTSAACPGSPSPTPAPTLRTCGQSCNTTTLLCDTNAGLTCRNSVCRNASCTNALQNSSCVCQGTPTSTPAPSTCSSPSGLSCGGSCNSSGQMQVNCSWTRDTRVSGYRFTYDDDSGFGSDATNINLTTSGTSANASYTMSSALPNVQHWFRVSNRLSDGSCVAALTQTSNTSITGPAVCSTYSCTGTRPTNSTIHNNDEPPVGSNLAWRHSIGDNTRQCEFYCNSGFTYNLNTNSCDSNSYTCGGTRPANTLYYSGDNLPTSSGVNWKYASPNTSAKCEYFCDTGYQWNATTGSCVLPSNACLAPAGITGSITCTSGGTLTASWSAVNGATSYRYQRNTSPTTTGALTATINGTSFSVAIDEPDVTNYFRTRVQTVGSSASCTAVGEWSAWRSVAANTSCAAPTDVPTACVRPNAVSVSESCAPPQIGASWDKVAGVLRYEYQIKRASDTWANRVASGTVAQPLGSVNPVMPAYLTEANPPDYSVRVRSVCSDGSGGEVYSPTWRAGLSSFVPPACGGPTPTPEPPPTYDVTVNLRVTDNNNCDPSEDSLLTGPLDGRVRVDPPDPAPIYTVPVPNTGTLTLSGLSGINVIRPIWPDFGDDDSPAYARTQLAGCSNPFSRTVDDPSDGPLNFYFTEVSGPWWQSSFGDIYGNEISSNIPPSATNENLSISSTDSEAGAVAWNTGANLSTGLPSQVGYKISNEELPFRENFDYFDTKLANVLQELPSNNINAINVGIDGFYRLSGPQELTSNWNSVTGKVVVLIEGPNASLSVKGTNPLGMGIGGFAFFIVDGPITFASEVDEVFGMFLSSEDITIEYDISNQEAFKGHGSFISTSTTGGIVSYRSLAGTGNTTTPATEFIYDPSLVINTPNALRSNPTIWTEVAP